MTEGLPLGWAFLPMREDDLDRVLDVEVRAYSFPWSRGNFRDSLQSGYMAEVLVDGSRPEALVGYFVAMPGVEEVHLLNLTVAPSCQRQGHARTLLERLQRRAVAVQARTLWLEVRASNQRALHVYERRGFARVGLRRGYYPAASSQREDAVVMRLPLVEASS